MPGVTLNHERPGEVNSYWMVTAVLDASHGLEKLDLMAALDERGVDSRPFFHPLSSLPAYAHLGVADECRERNKNAYAISARGVNLPSAYSLTAEDVRFVCRQFKEILSRHRASRIPPA